MDPDGFPSYDCLINDSPSEERFNSDVPVEQRFNSDPPTSERFENDAPTCDDLCCPSSLRCFINDSPSGNGYTNSESPATDGSISGPALDGDFANDPLAENGLCHYTNDPPPGDGVTNDPNVENGYRYSHVDVALLQAIQSEAVCLFPHGKEYLSPAELRKEVRSCSYKRGFEVTSEGNAVLCRQCFEPRSRKNKRDRKIAFDVVPLEKRRTHKKARRLGCPFRISYSRLKPKHKSDMSIRITRSSIYKHDNGCLPSRSQLQLQMRKSGSYTRSINKTHIKSILTLLKTGGKIPSKTLRKFV
jgi:hypothetical protein